MKNVTVFKEDLLRILRDNRKSHKVDYDDALDGYFKAAVVALEENLVAFKAGDRKTLDWSEHPPQNNIKEYDRTIKMLEMSVNEAIELTSDEFANYVQDDWSWKQNWTLSNSKYMSVTG